MTHQKLAAPAALLALALLSLNATAADSFYLGASIGTASLNEDFDGLNIDTNSTSYRLVAGWRFNSYFAIEGGYHDFGDFEQEIDINGMASTVSLSADGFTLGATGSFPIGEQFSLFGRAGWFFWNGDAEINSVSQATPEETNLYLGAGMSYAIGDHFRVIGDWTRYELESANSNVFSLGFQFGFGG